MTAMRCALTFLKIPLILGCNPMIILIQYVTMNISIVWFEIVSELLSIFAGWFAVVFIEPQLGTLKTGWEPLFRFFLALLLFYCQEFAEEVQSQS